MSRWLYGLLVMTIAIILGCGGGGGGVSASTVFVQGNVIWIETGSAPDPQATVRVGDQSTLTDAIDGYFSLEVPAGSSTLTVTYTPTSGSPVVRTFNLGLLTSDIDLGDVYIGPSQVTVTGQIIDSTSSSPVAGATIKMAGRNATSAADGRFSLTGVAYSSSTLSVFLGLQGTIDKTGYFSGFFSPGSGSMGGVVDVGSLAIVPQGSTAPPPLPFNVNGSITGGGENVSIQVLSGSTVIRTTSSDGLGQFKLWLPAGSYTVNGTLGSLSGSSNLTVSNVNTLTSVQITLN